MQLMKPWTEIFGQALDKEAGRAGRDHNTCLGEMWDSVI